MHLKVLLVPTLVILILVVAIGFIRPAVADMQMKQTELESVSAKLAVVERAEGNIDTLNASLDGRSETEAFVKQYLPESMDQDRPIDALNFLAAQSGVMLTGMEVEEVQRVVAVPVDAALDPIAAAEAEALAPPMPEMYRVSAEVRGSYKNIKAFLTRASRMNRLHDITAFDIKLDEEQLQGQGEGVVVDLAADLKGAFEANFLYFSGRSAVATVSAPLFQQSQVDFGPATAALERSTESIPSLDRPESGRPNPFRQ